MKLLKMITPTNDYEERVPVKFVKLVMSKLQRNQPKAGGGQPLLMDNKYMFAVSFPYIVSTLELDKINVPNIFNLSAAKLI